MQAPVKDTARDAWDTTKEGAKKVGSAVASGAGKAGRAVKGAASKVTPQSVKDAGSKVKDKARDGWDTTKEGARKAGSKAKSAVKATGKFAKQNAAKLAAGAVAVTAASLMIADGVHDNQDAAAALEALGEGAKAQEAQADALEKIASNTNNSGISSPGVAAPAG